MISDRFERELEFIESETKRMGAELQRLREIMPVDPVDAARRAEEVMGLESKMGALIRRKREIEDSLMAAATSQRSREAEARPAADVDELTSEIESVTDELMGIEIKMLRADMNGDEEEKQKLSMMASSLRSRRDSLVEAVKEIKAEQGREWDTVVLSVADNGIESREVPLRFTSSQTPIGKKVVNTAVSRAKRRLVLVCDREFWMSRQDELIGGILREVRPEDVESFNRRCPDAS